jgi:hypothetical protein
MSKPPSLTRSMRSKFPKVSGGADAGDGRKALVGDMLDCGARARPRELVEEKKDADVGIISGLLKKDNNRFIRISRAQARGASNEVEAVRVRVARCAVPTLRALPCLAQPFFS